MIVLHICQLHIMPSILHIILNTSNTLMSGVELMIGAKSRMWVHQKPTNQPIIVMSRYQKEFQIYVQYIQLN